MSPPQYVIYGDTAEDEELARVVFHEGALSGAAISRLPSRRADAPAGLVEFLRWERSDWLITRDGVLVAAAELSRHGYTGDNGFQRFARLQRAVSLGIPGIYFAPFSRSRLNEIDNGLNSPRNVAPEMFNALLLAGEEYGVPCLALRWPTDERDGEPIPLGDPSAKRAVDELREVMVGFATQSQTKSPPNWDWIPKSILFDMRVQAGLPVRGSEVRFVVDLPVDDVESDVWLHNLLPPDYFRSGKADKVLAKVALDATKRRRLPPGSNRNGFWTKAGRAQVLYFGYQWRPDPSCGLIAFSGTVARRDGLPLIVVWPRIFLAECRQRKLILAALREFHESGTGLIERTGRSLGYPRSSLATFQARINPSANQFGLFTSSSKVGRILADNVDLCVFGDALYLPR